MALSTHDGSGIPDLYRSSNLVVRCVPAGRSDRWVVTFDHYGIGHGFERPGFGEAYLQAQGISAIHVLGRGEDWYQYADIDAAMATVRLATQGAVQVLTYGSSMGGYAALRFANAVGATDVLALSPQYSIDPKIAPHEARWSQDIRRIRWRSELNGPVACSARAVIVYDPVGPDRWHGERISDDIGCSVIRLPYTAHPVTTFLAETGLLASLLGQILQDDFDPRAFRLEARRRGHLNGIYLGELAAAQPVRRAQTALALARRALDVSPGNYHAQVSLSRLLSREKRHDEALAILVSLVRESDRALTYVVDLGNALMLAGRLTEARKIADEVLARTADVAHLQAWAAHIYWLNDDVPDARRLIRNAVRLDPGNRNYLRALVDYYLSAPVIEGTRGVRVTPGLRIARWVTLRLAHWMVQVRLRPPSGRLMQPPFGLVRHEDDSASGGAT